MPSNFERAGGGSAAGRSPDRAQATDLKGRTALHLACAVKPSNRTTGEPAGLRTVAALLKAGAGLKAEAPMDEDEGDFRANPLWYAVARGGKNLPLVQFLLSFGADPSYSLWAVVWRDDDVVCRELLKNRPKARSQGPWRNANLLCGSPQTAEDSRSADRGGRESGDRGRQRPRRCRHRTCAPFAEEPDRSISRLQAQPSTSDSRVTNARARGWSRPTAKTPKPACRGSARLKGAARDPPPLTLPRKGGGGALGAQQRFKGNVYRQARDHNDRGDRQHSGSAPLPARSESTSSSSGTWTA